MRSAPRNWRGSSADQRGAQTARFLRLDPKYSGWKCFASRTTDRLQRLGAKRDDGYERLRWITTARIGSASAISNSSQVGQNLSVVKEIPKLPFETNLQP